MVWFCSYTELLRGPHMRQEQRLGWQVKKQTPCHTHERERKEGNPCSSTGPIRETGSQQDWCCITSFCRSQNMGAGCSKKIPFYTDMNLEGTSCFSLLRARCVGPVPIWGPFVMGGALSPHFSFWVLFFHVFSCTILIIISTSWRGVGGNNR